MATGSVTRACRDTEQCMFMATKVIKGCVARIRGPMKCLNTCSEAALVILRGSL
jgi:hypothetical protein